ncbi:MAG: penicillin-binding transpeptidase domain-containing protein [Bacillota bacterium]
MLKRAAVLLALILLMVSGLVAFIVKYIVKAPEWAHYPANKHLYAKGVPIAPGTIYDHSGSILFQVDKDSIKYNKNKEVRTAVMHAVGDLHGNVATGARVVFKDKLSGWDPVNGTYRPDWLSGTAGSITLTLDAELCAKAYREMRGRKGTVGIYNYKTGEIICMVSSPSFDPENPPDVDGNSGKYEGVYINRLLSSAYTPGSVFKLVTAAAAIENIDGIDGKVYQCEGKLNIDGVMVTCPEAHGSVTLEQALADSCNVAFALITTELGGDKLQKYADMLGFNSSLNVDGITAAAGSASISGASGADQIWAGIGQSTITANPLNVMAFAGAIANGGVRVTPGILAEGGEDGIFSYAARPREEKRILDAQTAEKLRAMMRNNVIKTYGEGNFKGLELCAKSGTAEVGESVKPHSWFAGFLDRDDYPLAFVVVIENSGSGSKVAGAVAGRILQAAVSGRD